ncbi:hypothetical protein C791_1301 [Amycolatopsis azurea DSM 43854]|uniref:Uncharacterized protein n=1 Tax=Amycolatopsis azurea DSM 43854 TaxID=1238180 RepID=M2PQ57_9PSEU|nr:hypothetical protein C791_1301 [Amycolatopsis azurea DSM 43854]
MQDEREPLGGSQGVQHHHQRHPDRVGQQRVVLGARMRRGGLGRQRPGGLFAPDLTRLEHVQADPGDDRGQPSARVLHLAGVGAADPQPRLLHRVLGVAGGAEHPVGHRPQAIVVFGEPLGQPDLFDHLSHSSVRACHSD